MFSLLRRVQCSRVSAICRTSKREIIFKRIPHLQQDLRPPPSQKFYENYKVPKGYKIIYITSNILAVNILSKLLPFAFLYSIYNVYQYFTDPKWLEKKIGDVKVNPTTGILFFACSVILYLLTTRHVLVICRKGNQYKSLMYFPLLNLRKKYLDFLPKDFVEHESGYCHFINNKLVFLNVSDFYDVREYYTACGQYHGIQDQE